MTPALVLILLLIMSGCAPQPDRYLTAEQDAQMRENCERDGCVVIPETVFQEMVRRMRQFGALAGRG
jgi:hypothetical protein